MCGVGYHHAGLDTADRKILETMFLSAELPVLCKLPFMCIKFYLLQFLVCTSTLAMGVRQYGNAIYTHMYDAILGKFSCTSCDYKVNTAVCRWSVLGILGDTGVADDRAGWETTGS